MGLWVGLHLGPFELDLVDRWLYGIELKANQRPELHKHEVEVVLKSQEEKVEAVQVPLLNSCGDGPG
jgi:hypothetical protein